MRSALRVAAALAAVLFAGSAPRAAGQDAPEADQDAVVVTVEVRQDVRITDPGKPLAEAWVAVVAPGEGPREAASHAFSTDPDGRAQLSVDADAWNDGAVVLVWKEGFAPLAFWADDGGPDGRLDGGPDVIPLEPAVSLETRVATRSGSPLAQARVEVSVDLPVHRSPPSSREVQTITFDALSDAFGGCVFAGLPDIAVTVRAVAANHVPAELYPAVPGEGPTRLVMRRGARVSGRVRLFPSGRPAEGAVVLLGTQRVEVDDMGAFDLRAIPPGEHELRVEGPGIVSPPPRRMLLAEGERRDSIVVPVVVAARLPGRLRDVDGRRVGEALVSVLWPRRTGLDEREAGDAQLEYDVVTDEGGGFLIESLRPADGVVVEVRAPGFAPQLIEGLSLPPGELARRLDVVLERGTEISGRVIGSNGAGLVAARVEARPAGDGRGRPPASWSLTGSDGSFLLDGLPDGPLGLVVLPPASSSAQEGSFGPFFGGAEQPERVGELSLSEGHVLRGRVIGAPAGAVLAATSEDGSHAEVVLDGEVFEIAGFPAGAVSLAVSSERAKGGAWGSADLPSGWPVELRWIFSRPVVVAIVDPLGAPVAAVGFSATPLDDDGSLPSHDASVRAADGSFTFDLEPGRWRLAARSEALFGRVEIDVPAAGPVAPVTLRLSRGETVRGEIGSLLTGAVIEGARIEIVVVGAMEAALPVATSDPRGGFEIPGVPAGVVRLRVTAAGHAPLRTPAHVVERAASLNVGRLDLDAGTRLVGKVWSAAGTPARGMSLTFEHDDGTRRDVQTDLYGRFEAAALPAGGGRLSYESLVWRVELPPRPETEIELDLGEGTRLEGIVTTRGRATAFARIVAWTLSEPARLTEARTDAHGRFALARLPAGLVRLEIAAPSLPPWQTDVVLSGAAVDYADLELPEGWVAGFVTEDDGGLALGGAIVRLVEVDAAGNLLRDAGGAVTDAQGRFRVESVAPGLYEVEARRGGSGSVAASGLRVTDGGLDDILLRLPREASLGIEIVDERGQGVAGAWLAAARLERDPLSGRRASTGLRGRAELGGLSPGLWEVAIGADGRGHVELGTVRLSEGLLDLGRVMLRAAGALRVVVVHPGYLPASGVSVSVVDVFDRDPRPARHAGGALFEGAGQHRTDADGILLLPELSPGVYFVYVDEGEQTLAIQVEPGGVAEAVLLVPWLR